MSANEFSRPLIGASVTADGYPRDEEETSWPPLSSSIRASAEQKTFDAASVGDEPHPESPPPPGGFIQHYEIIRKLGAGGMGIVLLARDTKLGRLVAIKLLRDSGRAAARLLAEARATARCRHESIVVIYGVDEAGGHPYMVLEYLDGRTLRELLSAGAGEAGRALPIGRTLDIVMSVVSALAAAHAHDIVHRDLKPENVMILDTGQVKVLDFGLAGRGDSRPRSGTLPYMAPEQWLGWDLDARTDLWAVGVLLYELLAGAHPLEPITEERLACIADLDQPMPRLREVRPELAEISDIVERCLRKRREDRFASAAELLAALEPFRDGGTPIALAEGELPFAGLAAFQESDAGRFFGRERDIAAVVGRLHRHRLVTVAAPSGAGKSSFIRAGVIPALKRSGENWDVLVLRPGRTPLSSIGATIAEGLATGAAGAAPIGAAELRVEPGLLGARLRAHCRARGAASRTLVFIDQFEELYTLVADSSERAAFIRCLLGVADDVSSPLRVILAIRSDFLDRIAEDRHLMAEVTACLCLLPPVGLAGLREALVRPVEAAGHRFEDEAMITSILDELAHAKTPLPLLQFSAMELWEARDREAKVLTRASYERLGGLAGALSAHADAVFAALSPSEQRLCQAVFLRLVTPERTRAIVSMRELASIAEDHAAAEALCHHLCGARLLLREVGGEEGSVTVELVHESLIERWPRLARWLDESTADVQFLARLRVAASQWQAGGEAPGLLWRDHAAEQARTWYERRRASPEAERVLPLGRLEQRYLLAVIALFERARRRRRRSIAVAFTLLCVVSLVVLFLAMRAQSHAKRADEEAARVKQKNSELAFQALRGRNAMRMLAARKRQDDPTLRLALLREVEPADIPKEWAELVSGALTSGVARDEVTELHGSRLEESPIYSAAISPDGTRIVVALDDKTAQILTTFDYRKLATLRGHAKYLWTVTWSPDGKRVVTASGDKTARIWNADGSGEPLVLRGHEAALNSAVMSPDGTRVVTASDDMTARIYDAVDGRQRVILKHVATVTAARFSPDGERVVTTSTDGMARVWDVRGVGTPLIFRGHTDEVIAAAWSPDGKRIATASRDTTVRVWDASTGVELFALRGHEDSVMGVTWSRDGKRIASTAKDKTARIWAADGTGSPLLLRGHKHWVYTADFSPDGRYLITASLDRTLRFWDLGAVVAPTVLAGHSTNIQWVEHSPDSAHIVTASQDGTLRIWSADGQGSPVVLRGHLEGGSIARWRGRTIARWSPDSQRIVTISEDGNTRIWNADGTAPPIILENHREQIWDVDWSATGERIVTASVDGLLRVWRSDSQALISEARIEASAHYVSARFDREGRRIVAINGHEGVYLWNLDERGGPVVIGRHDAGATSVQWSPDASRVVSTSADRTARIWDVRGAAAAIVLRGHAADVTFAAWSPDGTQLVTTSLDATARIWNADGSGKPVILREHGDGLSWASYSRDGARIATASADTTVRVWNADGSGMPFVLAAAPLGVFCVFFSPDGKHITHFSEEKVARVWPAVLPFSGPDDTRLWRATSYCIPTSVRSDLLHVTEAEARKDQETCERRVKEARAAEVDPSGTLPRDTITQ